MRTITFVVMVAPFGAASSIHWIVDEGLVLDRRFTMAFRILRQESRRGLTGAHPEQRRDVAALKRMIERSRADPGLRATAWPDARAWPYPRISLARKQAPPPTLALLAARRFCSRPGCSLLLACSQREHASRHARLPLSATSTVSMVWLTTSLRASDLAV